MILIAVQVICNTANILQHAENNGKICAEINFPEGTIQIKALSAFKQVMKNENTRRLYAVGAMMICYR